MNAQTTHRCYDGCKCRRGTPTDVITVKRPLTQRDADDIRARFITLAEARRLEGLPISAGDIKRITRPRRWWDGKGKHRA